MATTCIIGAGTAGLAMARELQDRGEEYVVLERRPDVGGLWNYEDTTAEAELWDSSNYCLSGSAVRDGVTLDAAGARPLYRDLFTNLPKETMAFADFQFPDEVPEFPQMRRQHFLTYIQQFARERVPSLAQRLEVSTVVRSVRWDDHGRAWEVASAPASAALSVAPRLRSFANIVVASGHHAKPIMPDLTGQAGFPGRVMHSCTFDSAEAFIGQRVLVVGGSVSAGQVAEILQRAGTCADVGISTRVATAVAYRALTSGAIAAAKRSGVQVHKELAELHNDGSVQFVDGPPLAAVDTIIAATGYYYSFPFLDTSNMDLLEEDGFNVQHLYKGLFYTRNPSLSFLGLHNTLMGPAQFFEHQARAVAAVIQGRTSRPLPSEAEMEAELAAVKAIRPVCQAYHLQPIYSSIYSIDSNQKPPPLQP